MPLVQKLQRATVNAIGERRRGDPMRHRATMKGSTGAVALTHGRSRTVPRLAGGLPRCWHGGLQSRHWAWRSGSGQKSARCGTSADRSSYPRISDGGNRAAPRQTPAARSRGHHPSGRGTKLRHRSVRPCQEARNRRRIMGGQFFRFAALLVLLLLAALADPHRVFLWRLP
jgi:hypothetical protein